MTKKSEVNLNDRDSVRAEISKQARAYIQALRAAGEQYQALQALERAHRGAAGADALPAGIAEAVLGAICVDEGFAGYHFSPPATPDAAVSHYERATGCGYPAQGLPFEPSSRLEQFALCVVGRYHEAVAHHGELVKEQERLYRERRAALEAELADAFLRHKLERSMASELGVARVAERMGDTYSGIRPVAVLEALISAEEQGRAEKRAKYEAHRRQMAANDAAGRAANAARRAELEESLKTRHGRA